MSMRHEAGGPDAAALREQFLLDPTVAFLNHGSFGACPRPVLERCYAWQREAERQPVEFFGRRFTALMAEARAALAAEVGTHADNLVYVPNATIGLNIVAASLRLAPGDEILTTDHEYGALDRTWTRLCERSGATYRRLAVGAPRRSHAAFGERFWSAVSERTRVIFLSHITSPTALVFPVAEICRRARSAGIRTVIDGAHALGQVPLDLEAIGADCYAGNAHKWLCAPKGSAFLYVRPEAQPLIEPLVVSWGWRPREPGHSRFLDEQEWQGTRDVAPFLSVPAAIAFLREHQWEAVRRRCHELVLETARRLVALPGVEPLSPHDDEWLAQMVSVAIPPCDRKAFQARLYGRYRVEVPITDWNGRQLLRVSVQGYNDRSDVDRLIAALARELPR